MDEATCQKFGLLPHIGTSISKDIKISLFYIVDYVSQKGWSIEEEIFCDATSYYQDNRNFLKETDCGDFKISVATTIQWILFIYLFYDI